MCSDCPEQKKSRAYGLLSVIKDLILGKAEYASDNVKIDRMRICSMCTEMISATQQCKQCACFLPLKVKHQKSTCPLGKW